jgi:hypothetical protein
MLIDCSFGGPIATNAISTAAERKAVVVPLNGMRLD